jgi:hypothetical protein
MMVDFPEPDGPIRPIDLPASKVQLKFLRTLRSGFDG